MIDAIARAHASSTPRACAPLPFSWPTLEDRVLARRARDDEEWQARQEEIVARGWILPTYRPQREEPSRWRSADGSPYGLAVLERAVAEIHGLTKGNRNAEIARIAYTVGGFVGGGEIDRDHALALLEGAAEAIGEGEAREMKATARRCMANGTREPLRAPEDDPEPEASSRKRSTVGAPRGARRFGWT